MSLNLARFNVGDMLQCSLQIRQLTPNESTMEGVARKVCRYFYDELQAAGGDRACALIRLYKVHPFGKLPPDVKRFARRAYASTLNTSLAIPIAEPPETMQCLALLATAGDEPAWNDRRASRGHQAIPLPSPQIIQRAPMIAQLIQQLGLSLADVVMPGNAVRDLEGKSYGVFHIAEALGSPYIPAQVEFVERFGIRSVIGFGGSVFGGEIFAVILFARVHVDAATADRFRTIALDVKGTLLPFAKGPVFETALADRG